MSDIINSVKEEILRLADKQAAAQIGKAQQVAAQYRSEAIELRRLLKQQEREIKYLKKQTQVEHRKTISCRAFAIRRNPSDRNADAWAYRQSNMPSWLAFRR